MHKRHCHCRLERIAVRQSNKVRKSSHPLPSDWTLVTSDHAMLELALDPALATCNHFKTLEGENVATKQVNVFSSDVFCVICSLEWRHILCQSGKENKQEVVCAQTAVFRNIRVT